MANIVAKIVLPALPAPISKSFGAKKRAARMNSPGAKTRKAPDDIFAKGMLLAIQDMQSLLGHVCALLSSSYAEELGITAWMNHLHEVLLRLEDSTFAGKITSANHLTIDDEEPADLKAALERTWDSADQEWPEGAEFELLAKLMQYWLDQVEQRGDSLLSLLMGTGEDLVSATRSLASVGEIRYPIL